MSWHPHLWHPTTQVASSPEPLQVRSARGCELERVLCKLKGGGNAERYAQHIWAVGGVVDRWGSGGILNAHVVAELEDETREQRIPSEGNGADAELSGKRFGERWQLARKGERCAR